MCVCESVLIEKVQGLLEPLDTDTESSEEWEAKWRSYSNTVSDVLDTRGLGGGREGGRSRIR